MSSNKGKARRREAQSQSGISDKTEKTVVRALALGGVHGGGGPAAVDVKDGKIVRVRPLHYDWKYKWEYLNPWKFQRNGKTLEPVKKTLISPFSLAYKKRAYSPNRIKYPLKRIDWDPKGERNPQNRGISKYKRISWDEAAEIVASEIKRIHKKYGVCGILTQADGHGECKTINTPHGHETVLLDRLGGCTQQVRNPDSWEGWYWGSKHVWGQGHVGMMNPSGNVMKDISEHTEMLLHWGSDPETTAWGFVGQFASRLMYFWTDAGIKQVFICPDLNYSAAIHADKWIPVLPNTDAALQLAIIYIWLKEGTYDKQYVKTHTVGFDTFKDYVLGKEDGVPKTPAWASPKCGVPECTIKALARETATKITSIAHYFGGSYVRGPYSHEPARLECIMLGMQGLGKPGVHQTQVSYKGMPRAEGVAFSRGYNYALSERIRKPVRNNIIAWGKQLIPKTLIDKAISSGDVTFMGSGAIEAETEDQFIKYHYPIPREKGGAEIHMIWCDSPCRTTCWNCGMDTIEALRSPGIECFVVQHPWLENDCLYADIILPANTTFEVEDVVTNTRQGTQFASILWQEQAIKPIGESKSDFEIMCEVARKFGLYEELNGNKTAEELIKSVFEAMQVQSFISWEEFKEKKYFAFPVAKDWEKDSPGLRKFYEDPEKNPLPTPSGKLEFYSERLAKAFPDDKERPPIPKWIEKSETHDERISSIRAKAYPLLVVSNHGRWRVHAQCDDISWTREAPTCKITGFDGYKYEPVWMHPSDAAKRGINHGDIVKVFNERGAVLCGAYVSERIMPGAVSIDHGARCDAIIPGKLDRGGAIDLITPEGITSKNCVGQATSGFLVQVEKVSVAQMDEWRRKYPEAFSREYDPASGLRFNAWVIE